MPTDPFTPLTAASSRWINLERDWQSVTIGAAVVVLIVAFGVQVPW